MSIQAQTYRDGPQPRISGKIQAGVKVGIGDFVALVGNYMVPSQNFTGGSGSGSGSGSGGGETAFKQLFCGVLIAGSTSGTETADSDCIVATDGTYEYPIAPAGQIGSTLPPGQPVEVAFSGTNLLQQQVVLTSTRQPAAIALTARETKPSDQTVFVRIYSSIMGQPLS